VGGVPRTVAGVNGAAAASERPSSVFLCSILATPTPTCHYHPPGSAIGWRCAAVGLLRRGAAGRVCRRESKARPDPIHFLQPGVLSVNRLVRPLQSATPAQSLDAAHLCLSLSVRCPMRGCFSVADIRDEFPSKIGDPNEFVVESELSWLNLGFPKVWG